jgi:DNA-binding NarL/FixJ family response regulator
MSRQAKPSSAGAAAANRSIAASASTTSPSVGEGLSNRAVAERLTLSVRTVESHVYRAELKTGISSGGELAALLPRSGARTQ